MRTAIQSPQPMRSRWRYGWLVLSVALALWGAFVLRPEPRIEGKTFEEWFQTATNRDAFGPFITNRDLAVPFLIRKLERPRGLMGKVADRVPGSWLRGRVRGWSPDRRPEFLIRGSAASILAEMHPPADEAVAALTASPGT